jgi:drug/metabolite transporter (DMT)-like permease
LRNLHIPTYFYPLAAMLFWGMSFVWTSILLNYYQPVTIIFIRLILSSSFLFLIIFLTKKYEKIPRSDYWLFLLSALFNPFFYFLCENYGLKYSSSTIAAVIIATIPVFSPIAGFITFRERLSLLNIAGIGISFSGIVIMLIAKDLSLGVDLRGVLFLGGAVLASLFYSVFLRKLTMKYTPLTIISRQNLIGIFLFLPFFVVFEAHSTMSVKINPEIIRSFLLLSVLASSLSFVFYTKTIQLFGISKANIFSNLIPVFTAIFSYFLLAESFTLQKAAGILVVIGGVYLSEINRKKPVSGAR